MIPKKIFCQAYIRHLLTFAYIFLISAMLFVTITSVQAQEPGRIDVTVTGLNDELRKNTLAHLTLTKQKNIQEISEYRLRALVKKAREEIKTALQPFGYYHPVIHMDTVNNGDAWKVIIDVDSGEPVIINQVEVVLSGPGRDEKQILSAIDDFPLVEGGVLDHQLYEKGKRELIAQANASGYINATFSRHEILVDRKLNSAGIHLVLETGNKYYFGRTTFDVDFLSHNLLTRMLPYKEGDPYSARELVRLRQSLYNSDYFSAVEVVPGEIREDTFSVPVLITLEPKNRNVYGLGVGYGTDTGLRGTVEWTNRLINKYGHQFKLTLQPSERKSYFGGVYTIPIKDPRTDRLSLLGKWEKEIFENTESEQRSVSVSYDQIHEQWEYSIYLKFLDEDFDSGVETGHATLLIPGLKTTFRLTNNRLVTDKGIRATFALAGADQNLLSDASFVQASLSAKGIYSFFEDFRLIGRFQLGGTLVDDIGELPPTLRFYAGGDQSVRGYAYKSIGPYDSYGNVLGGRYLVTYSLELEKRLTDRWSAAVFFDSGDALDSFTNIAMKNGAGIGLRWNAPFGQVRVDLANPVSEGDGSWRIHFNVGADL